MRRVWVSTFGFIIWVKSIYAPVIFLITALDDDLSLACHQAITSSSTDISLIGSRENMFQWYQIEIKEFSFRNICWKMSSLMSMHICRGFHLLIHWSVATTYGVKHLDQHNGLSFGRCRVITRSNAGVLLHEPLVKQSVKFKSKYNYLSRKFISKCRLSHFAQASID